MIEIRGLRVVFKTTFGEIEAVRGVDFTLNTGEVIGIVGESGCGKSTSFLALTGILPKNAKINYKAYFYKEKSVKDLSQLRGKKIAYIFQDPQSSLNPVMKINEQLAEALLIRHPKWNSDEVREALHRLLLEVRIEDPEIWLSSYPHQLSGGMKQRIMIAMALALEPEFLVADEPTTSLDVTIQSDILKLLVRIKEERKMGIVLITHDLNIARKMCDRIYVMYTGKVVETGPTQSVIHSPKNRYTRMLLDSVPDFDRNIRRFKEIPGQVPDVYFDVKGCSFANRCPFSQEKCLKEEPALKAEEGSHYFACFYPE